MSEVTATEHVRLQADNHRVDADDSEANIPTERDPAPATRPTSDVGRRTSDMSQDSRIAVAAPTRRAPLPIPEAPVQPELPPPNGHLRSPRERLLHSALSTQRSALVSEALLVGLVVLLLCLCYLSLRWYGFDLLEEGYFLTNARAVQLGSLPYRDFDTPYTPGVFYLYAALLSRFGPHVTTLRTIQVAGRAVFFIALYVCGRQVLPPFFAALAPATIALMDTAPETWGIHPGWYSAPATIVAALAVARYLTTGRGRWLFVSGIASGIGFAFKQNLPAYGLMAALWFLVVAERQLPSLMLPSALARSVFTVFRLLPPFLVLWTRRTLQALALVLFPLVAAVIVRPYLSGLVFCLFVLPLAALSCLAAWYLLASRERADSALAFFLRPLLVLAGFAAVTLPWLVLMLRALEWQVRFLGPLVGQVDPSGYFYGMKPPTLDHVRVVAWTLLAPVGVGALAAWGLWSRRGVALVLAGLSLLVAAGIVWAPSIATTASSGEPWHVIRGGYLLLRTAIDGWREYGDTPHQATDLLLYLPALAFWASLAYGSAKCKVQSAKWPDRVPQPGQPLSPQPSGLSSGHSALSTQHSALYFWFLAAGAALFLNQYPRMDEIHWLWSSGLLLVCGAVVLHAWYDRALWLAPALVRSTSGRAVFCLSLTALPLVAVFPHVWSRLNFWPGLVPAPPAEAHAATAGARVALAPLAMPDGRADVWVPADDQAAIREVVELLDQRTAPNEPVFAYPAIPGFYFLADRPNATRFDHLFRGMASPADEQVMVRQLERVRYVVWDDGGAHYWVAPGDNAPVTEYVRTHFRVERFIGPYAVLSRDARGPSLSYFPPPGTGSR